MELNDIIKPENLVYEKPRLMNENPMHYCPGCSHGVIHKLIAEVIADMGLEDKTIGISPVGCAVFAYNYLDIDWIEAAHGRAPAIASAVKRLNPEKMVRHSMAGEVMIVLTFRVLGQSRTERSKSMALVLVRLVLPTVGT